MKNFFKPAAHIERLPQDKIDPLYKKLRLQVFLSIFIGYAAYYLLRKNFTIAMPYLHNKGFSSTELGFALSGTAIAYGLSKFIMGNISDRCNPRFFLAAGLILCAVVNFFLGLAPFATATTAALFVLLFLSGWFQGMGWPPCGRTMVHWYSIKERGTRVAIWNVAHNVGGGLIGPLSILAIFSFGDWHSIFYFPAIICLFIATFVLLTLRDTPQSVGLPPIEIYHNEMPNDNIADREKELTAREILVKYILPNKYLWYIAIANIFVYFVRYGVIDWAPTYLSNVKGFSHDSADWAYFMYEYAGIPGTILCGWLSDKVFSGRRAPIGIIYMVLVLFALLAYWLNPGNSLWVYDLALISIGFLIYGPVMLIGLFALDLVPKKAAGTAAGLTGLFGYFIGTAILANIGIGYVVDHMGWNAGFGFLCASCLAAIFFLSLTWNAGKL